MRMRFSLKLLSTALATVALLTVLAASTATAQTFTSLYSFTGSPDGAEPYAGVIMDKSGALYGTTYTGGSGSGTVYTFAKGTETLLYTFTGGADGGGPFAALVMDSKGNLYGTTVAGGSGYGTVFAVNPTTKKETVLYTFTGGADGALPFSGLLLDAKGNLYGTTEDGGSGYGTVYKVNIKTKKETVLYSFAGGTDGELPLYGNLIADSKGNLYGTTVAGGSTGNGTVWEVSPKGKEKILYNFCPVTGCADGTGVFEQSLAMDPSGNLYGTTEEGGASGTGTVFKLNPKTGKEKVLYSFTNGADGGFPSSGLVRDSKGNLYGTTQIGGTGDGVVFEVTGTKETVLHSFDGTDGSNPFTSPLIDEKGTLYGTTYLGGASGDGTIYSLKP